MNDKRPAGTIDAFIGLLAGKSRKKATIEEINEATASGWADVSFGNNNLENSAVKRKKSKNTLRVRTW